MKIIVASHGKFAEGIKNTVEMIGGNNPNIIAYCAYDDNGTNLDGLKDIIEKNASEELIVCTDLYGGSVNNFLIPYAISNQITLIAGVNVALLLSLSLATDLSKDIIKNLIEESKTYTVFFNDSFEESEEEEEF